MSNTLIFGIMFSGVWALLGVTFFIVGIVMLKNMKKKERKCTSKTYGKVKDIVKHQNYDRDDGYSTHWHPVIEYNVGQLKFIKEFTYGSTRIQYAIGQDVEVYYNPENYNEYYIAGNTLQKNLATIFTIVGIGATIVAIFCAILII